jgi:hypothetical protein
MFRTQESASDDNGNESVEVQTVTKPFAVEEQKHYGISFHDAAEHDRSRK